MSIAHGIEDDYIYRGQKKNFTGTFSTPTNITGWTIEQRFRLIRNGIPIFTLTCTTTDATNGIVTSSATAVQTRLLTGNIVYCDYWRTDSGNETPLAWVEITVKETILSSAGL